MKRWDGDIIGPTESKMGTVRIAKNWKAWRSLGEAFAMQSRIQQLIIVGNKTNNTVINITVNKGLLLFTRFKYKP